MESRIFRVTNYESEVRILKFKIEYYNFELRFGFSESKNRQDINIRNIQTIDLTLEFI